MSHEENIKWNTKTEQVDAQKETEHKEKFNNIQPEQVSNFIFDTIKNQGAMENWLNNEDKDRDSVYMRVNLKLQGAPSKYIELEFDAKRDNLLDVLTTEISNEVQKLNLQGSQNIEAFNMEFKPYKSEIVDGKEEKTNNSGGFHNLMPLH
jgi:hypothetical protein